MAGLVILSGVAGSEVENALLGVAAVPDVAGPVVDLVVAVVEPAVVVVFFVLVSVSEAAEPVVFVAVAFVADAAELPVSVDIVLAFLVLVAVSAVGV